MSKARRRPRPRARKMQSASSRRDEGRQGEEKAVWTSGKSKASQMSKEGHASGKSKASQMSGRRASLRSNVKGKSKKAMAEGCTNKPSKSRSGLSGTTYADMRKRLQKLQHEIELMQKRRVPLATSCSSAQTEEHPAQPAEPINIIAALALISKLDQDQIATTALALIAKLDKNQIAIVAERILCLM